MEDYYSDASGNSSSDYDHENYQLDPQDTQQRPQYQKHHQEPLFMSYLQLKDSRPAHLWEGDTNVFLFFKQFEQQVENIPGISTDIVWEELKLRVGGLAKRVISPYDYLAPRDAISKAKGRLWRIWGSRRCIESTLLYDAVAGEVVEADDKMGLCGLSRPGDYQK